MQLTPRYGPDPLIVIGGDPSAIGAPVIAQRRRFAAALAALDVDQWAQPSRCEGWTVQDVIVHLESTNAFWGYSIRCGLAGEPSELLATFDPVASPAQMVRDAGALDPETVLGRFTASNERLEQALVALDDAGWTATAEAPPGHLSVAAVAHHALWDSWVHERDVLLPLGLVPEVHDDEVLACLRYASALSPAFAVVHGDGRTATLGIDATDPAASLRVEVGQDRVAVVDGPVDAGTPALVGGAVDLVEALSQRQPMPCPVPDDVTWMLDGLARVFDQA